MGGEREGDWCLRCRMGEEKWGFATASNRAARLAALGGRAVRRAVAMDLSQMCMCAPDFVGVCDWACARVCVHACVHACAWASMCVGMLKEECAPHMACPLTQLPCNPPNKPCPHFLLTC